MNSTFLFPLLRAALLAALLGLGASLRADVEVGKPVPDFTLTDVMGQMHKLSEFKGRTVVLEWVNPECPFVRKHYESGNIPKLQKAAAADKVVWLSINSGAKGQQGDYTAEQVAEWSKNVGAAPLAYFRDQDGKVGKLYGAKTTPDMYVINAAGILVYQGAIDSIRSADVADLAKATNYVTAALTAVKAGKPVEKTVTEPYGCTVKY